MTYKELDQLFRNELHPLYPDSEIRAILRVLAEFYEGISLVTLHLCGTQEIESNSLHSYLSALAKLKDACPVQYLTGETWFMDLKLKITPAALIPRPEAEELVNLLIETEPKSGDLILDLCTGSGCIALGAAHYLPETEVWAVDFSEKALSLATENARNLNLKVNFIRHDILQAPPEHWPGFQRIVSNPPYVLPVEAKTMSRHVLEFEPEEALFVTNGDPLQFYKAILTNAHRILTPDGVVLLECNAHYAGSVAELFSDSGFQAVKVLDDLSGNPRFVKALMS